MMVTLCRRFQGQKLHFKDADVLVFPFFFNHYWSNLPNLRRCVGKHGAVSCPGTICAQQASVSSSSLVNTAAVKGFCSGGYP